jgi:hypothetical protein
MEINAYLIHLSIFFIALVYYYYRYILAQRENASFELYKVRDELVYLVASDKMKETDAVFSYYYKRVNAILSMTPKVGIDDVLTALYNNPKSFEKALKQSKKETEKILKTNLAQDNEVKKVIEAYYVGIKHLVLSHSSILKVIFIVTRQFNPIKRLFEKVVSNDSVIREAYDVAEFAEQEASVLHGSLCRA